MITTFYDHALEISRQEKVSMAEALREIRDLGIEGVEVSENKLLGREDELGNELAAEDYRRQVYLPECGQSYEFTLRSKRKQASFVPSFTLQKNFRLCQGRRKASLGILAGTLPGKMFFRIPACPYLAWPGGIGRCHPAIHAKSPYRELLLFA